MDRRRHGALEERFLNKEALEGLDSDVPPKRVWQFSVYGMVASFVATLIPTFAGYDLTTVLTICFFAAECLLWVLSAALLLVALCFSWRYRLFQKKWMPLLCLGGYFLLMAFFSALAYFTAKPNAWETGFSTSFNPVYFLFFYLPLLILWYRFCDAAYMRHFSQYVVGKNYYFDKPPGEGENDGRGDEQDPGGW